MFLTAFVLTVAGQARAQGISDSLRLRTELALDTTSADVRAVMALERTLWQAWRNGDSATIARLSDPAYQSIAEGSLGGLSEVLRDVRATHLVSYTLGPMAPLRVTRDVIVLNYRGYMQAKYVAGEREIDVSRPVAESSIWVRRAGEWRNVMLHETTIAPVRLPHAASAPHPSARQGAP
jgi:hypothetical protein